MFVAHELCVCFAQQGISELYVMPDMKTNQLKVLLGDRAVAKRFQLFTHISNERDCFFLSIDPTPENLTRIDNALLDLYGLTFFARVEPDGSGERKLAVIKSCNKASDSFIRERSLYTKFVMQKTNVVHTYIRTYVHARTALIISTQVRIPIIWLLSYYSFLVNFSEFYVSLMVSVLIGLKGSSSNLLSPAVCSR